MVESILKGTKCEWGYSEQTYVDDIGNGVKLVTKVVYDEAKKARETLAKTKKEIKKSLGDQLGVERQLGGLGYNVTKGSVVRDKTVGVLKKLFTDSARVRTLIKNYKDVTGRLSCMRRFRDSLEEALNA